MIGGESLYQLVSADPAGVLGAATAATFEGRYPFLAKLLRGRAAVVDPRRIRRGRRPSTGMRRDEAAGIPRDAADRNYKDAWPKPEMLVALGTFDALVGFRPLDRSVAFLEALGAPELKELTGLLREGKLREAFTHFMSDDRDSIRPLVAALDRGMPRVRRCRVGAGGRDAREALRGLPRRPPAYWPPCC